MKIKLIIFSLCFFSFALPSCKTTFTNTNHIQGLYIGTYTIDQVPSQGEIYYSFAINPDGTLITDGKGPNNELYFASGTWKLVGNVFSFEYSTTDMNGNHVPAKGTAIFKSEKLTNAIWHDITFPNLTGKFPTMLRVK